MIAASDCVPCVLCRLDLSFAEGKWHMGALEVIAGMTSRICLYSVANVIQRTLYFSLKNVFDGFRQKGYPSSIAIDFVR